MKAFLCHGITCRESLQSLTLQHGTALSRKRELKLAFLTHFGFFHLRGLAVFAIMVICHRATGQHGQVYRQFERLFSGIQGSHIPILPVATRQHDVTSGVTVDKLHFIPHRRNPFHEVYLESRHIRQVVRCQCKILDRILESHGCSQLENVGGDTGRAAVVPPVHALVEEGAAELHTSHGVANKGMKRGIECFVVAEMLVENHILGCQHGLATHIVGIHALPAARQRTTVEDDHQPVVVGIAQDGLVKAHRLLLVAAEEVHLDALHAPVAATNASHVYGQSGCP